jgi:hypothetical protein
MSRPPLVTRNGAEAVVAPGPPGAAPGPLRRSAASLAFAVLALGMASVVWFALPHDRQVDSAGLLLFKLTPFAAATAAIALADPQLLRRWKLHLVAIPGGFLVFFCFFVPRLFFYSGSDGDFERLYYTMLTAVPFMILMLTLAYRLGGGSGGTSARLAVAMLLLMLSGLEDLAFLVVNPHTDPRWTPIPEVWTWASHMEVFLGHPPTNEEAYAFIAVHVVLALLVLFLPGRVVVGPLRRGWRRWRGRPGSAAG